MSSPRRWFLAALGVYGIWVVALAALAVLSATAPRSGDDRPKAAPAGTPPSSSVLGLRAVSLA